MGVRAAESQFLQSAVEPKDDRSRNQSTGFWLILLNIFLIISIFSLDLLIPLGVAVTVPYVALVLMAIRVRNKEFILLVAIAASVLTVAGYFLSPGGNAPWMMAANRAIVLFAIWVTAAVAFQRRSAVKDLEEMKALVDHASDAVFWQDADGKFRYVNEATCRYLGYTPEEMRSLYVYDVNPRLKGEAWRNYWERVKRAGSVFFESVHRTKDGREIPVDVSANYVKFDGEEYLFSYVRESSERKQLEEQLRQSQKMEALGRLASGVAHDFNSSLSIILGRAEMLAPHIRDPEARQHLELLEKAVEGAAGTVKRLQQFARRRPDRPGGTLRVNRAVAEVVELTRPRWKTDAGRRGVDIQVSVETRAFPDAVRGEEAEVQEVLVNLINNAVEAMPRGGRIAVATENAREGVALTVSDTGVGMSEEQRAKALEPFYSTKGEENSGLGLSMVFGIVQRYEGRISIHSRPGRGTSVRIILPAAREEADTARETRTGGAAVSSLRGRILIIDDDRDVGGVLADILRAAGHEAVFEADPREGLQKHGAAPFDVVITDLGMPGLSGRDVAKAVKERDARVPVILLTGWGADLDPDRKRPRTEVDLALAKPIRADELLKVVGEFLERRRKGEKD